MINPLIEIGRPITSPKPCILVIFGVTGDLSERKILPSLYTLGNEGMLPANFACVGFARREKSDHQFRQDVEESIKRKEKYIDLTFWNSFQEDFFYHRSNFDEDEGYIALRKKLNELDSKIGSNGNRVFYFATPPKYFPIIVEKLATHNLLQGSALQSRGWKRVIIEKPFGLDFKSALDLQAHLLKFLKEEQIYRIDHYLGKETVQNLLFFRFGNSIFESIWNYKHIDHVQITVAEDLGVGTRGHLFEESGTLRDMLQNHLMQLLSLVAMEPPTTLHPDEIHQEKIKVLQSIRDLNSFPINDISVRGQYGKGYINGEEVISYREEKDISKNSNVESYVALKLFIDNWRWSGVPFYLRTGRRLPKRATEISIIFKDPPGYLFPKEMKEEANVLSLNIQPDEGISLKINCKVPGQNLLLQPVKMDFKYHSYFGQTPPDAYVRLIYDAILGDNTLFARQEEVLLSWKILDPLLEHWRKTDPIFPNYAAGSFGPKAADDLLQKEGRRWRYI